MSNEQYWVTYGCAGYLLPPLIWTKKPTRKQVITTYKQKGCSVMDARYLTLKSEIIYDN